MSVILHANPIKPYFSLDLRPNSTLEGTPSTSDHAIPDDELPADSFSDYHPIQHTWDSQHKPTASDTPDSPDTLYNVEQVLKHCTHKGKKQILAKWKGYGPEHNLWSTRRMLYKQTATNNDTCSDLTVQTF